MSYFLFLDDSRVPSDILWPKDWPLLEIVITRSYDEFAKTLVDRGVPTIVSFDHDLAFEHYIEAERRNYTSFNYNAVKIKTGYHCAILLKDICIRNKQPLPKWFVHSLNPIGKRNIHKVLSGNHLTLE